MVSLLVGGPVLGPQVHHVDYVQPPVRQLDSHHFERSTGLIVTKDDDSVIAACGIGDDQLHTRVTNDMKGACFANPVATSRRSELAPHSPIMAHRIGGVSGVDLEVRHRSQASSRAPR